MITDIAWDFDGTLCDSYPHITSCACRALEEATGKTAGWDEMSHWVHISVGTARDHFIPDPGGRRAFDSLFARLNDTVDYASVKPFPGILDVLAAFQKEGCQSHVYSHRGPGLEDYLDHWGFRPYMDIVISQKDNFPRKPAPDALLSLMKRRGIGEKNLLMAGDRPIDIDAAKNAGARALFFDTGNCPVPRNADWVTDSWNALLPCIPEIVRG